MNFSWFYFDLITKDGQKVIIIFYGHPFFLSFDIALCDITIYQNHQKFHLGVTCPRQNSLFSIDSLTAQIAGSELRKQENSFLINLDDNRIKGHLSLKPVFNSITLPTISLIKEKQHFFNWRVIAPYLDVEGFIELQNEEISLKGTGYLDYNEGNFVLNSKVRSWSWGRFHGKNETVSWGSVLLLNGERKQPVFICNHQGYSYFEPSEKIETDGAISVKNEKFNWEYQITRLSPFDNMHFLISRFPPRYTLFRKIHEFIFYRLEESKMINKFNRPLANTEYKRYTAELSSRHSGSMKGMIETIDFH
ncbi:MAG: hypothetical protein WAN36_00345 [Calditrichia bacterium]